MITDGFVNTKNYFSQQVSIIFYFFHRIRLKRADMAGRLRAFRPAAGVFCAGRVCGGGVFRGGRRFVHCLLWRFAVEGGKTGVPKIAAERDFWERGAAGAAGKAASAARRPPWRLAATSRRSFGCFAELPFPFGSFGKASRSMAARAREQPALRAAGLSLYYISTGKKAARGDDQYPPKPLKGSPRRSVASLARTARAARGRFKSLHHLHRRAKKA